VLQPLFRLCIVVKPETVIAGTGKGFRLLWTWKVWYGQPGRPSVPKDVRDLIRHEPSEPNLGHPQDFTASYSNSV